MEENGHKSFGFYSHRAQTFPKTVAQVLQKRAATTASLFLVTVFIGAFIATHFSIFSVSSFQREFFTTRSAETKEERTLYLLNCSVGNVTQTCSKYPNTHIINGSSTETCPEYFRWIHEDLWPWVEQGITRDMVERAKSAADIRIVIVNGSLYMEKYKPIYQTRHLFTIWGILQLLRLYPGKLPDLDLMFLCNDKPLIKKSDYNDANASNVPPLFHYCGDDSTLDIVFPDWSFWGWPEINIQPWVSLKKELEKGNHQINWTDREPYAHWKGNTYMGEVRKDLVKCDVTDKQDWNARIYHLTWSYETQKGFKNTKLADKCNYRYKIYAEGIAWSVSEKYILACDSMTLLIKPQFYEFFTRDLIPTIHYWPIKASDKCKSIKYAVDWGNKHTQEAQNIGKAGSRYIQEQLKMKFVYDYMFHLLNEYAELLNYKPTVPPGAVEMCLETMACNAEGLDKKFKIDSMVESPSDTGPCTMPPPYSPLEFQAFLERKENLTKQVEMWEESGKI